MLAKSKSLKVVKALLVAVICCVLSANSISLAQYPQQPSQRYQPSTTVPPKTHVPDGSARPLSASRQAAQQFRRTQSPATGTTFNFSDTPARPAANTAARPTHPGHAVAPSQVRQVSFDQPITPGSSADPLPTILQQPQDSLIKQPAISRRMDQANRISPVVSQQGFQPPADQLPTRDNNTAQATNLMNPNQPLSVGQDSPAKAQQVQQVAFNQSTNDAPQDPQIPTTQKNQFVTEPSAAASTKPLRGNGISGEFNGLQLRTPNMDNQVRTASRETDIQTERAQIDMIAPSIRVQTFGPNSIGINKTAPFRVVISNDGNQTAEHILVGLNLPEWVDLSKVEKTTGEHKITDGRDQARLMWTVDRVPGRGSQTINIKAIPRQAEPFKMSVEWTFVPRVAKTDIVVTEPKLEMSIQGPSDVQYGAKEDYRVEVRNPGTGIAENVRVKLPEALGGESQVLGDIQPGDSIKFHIELLARTSGELDLQAIATADGDLETSVNHQVLVRRANLKIELQGPAQKYAGTNAKYTVRVVNDGNAIAKDVFAALAVPSGVEYLSGINNADQNEMGLSWNIGALNPGEEQVYELDFALNTSGDLQLEAGVQAAADLSAASSCRTQVETVADLILSVEDPRGPLPTGEDVSYQVRIKNRGTRAATNVNVVMHFAEGIEPTDAKGKQHKIRPGEVTFEPIDRVDPGQEVVLTVVAQAQKSGTHIFRAQMTCDDSDSREVAEGTTRFYGDAVEVKKSSDVSKQADSQFTPGGIKR